MKQQDNENNWMGVFDSLVSGLREAYIESQSSKKRLYVLSFLKGLEEDVENLTDEELRGFGFTRGEQVLRKPSVDISDVQCLDLREDWIDRVEELRENKGILIHQMASFFGIANHTYHRWKKKQNQPRRYQEGLVYLMNEFNLPTNYFFEEEEN